MRRRICRRTRVNWAEKLIDYWIMVPAIIILLSTAVWFWTNFRSDRGVAIAVGNTKRSTIAELKHLRTPDGGARVVKLEGTLSCSEPWRSSLASVPCCWSKVSVEGEHYFNGDETWIPNCGPGIIRQVPMKIQDGTGTASIDATGARILYEEMVYEEVTRKLPKLLWDIPAASETGRYRIQEFVIRPGAHAVVVGPLAQASSSSGDPVIGVSRLNQASSAHTPYIIALGDEAKVRRETKGTQRRELILSALVIGVITRVFFWKKRSKRTQIHRS